MWQHLLFITSFVGQKSVIFIYFCPVIQQDARSCTQLKILLCCVAPVGYPWVRAGSYHTRPENHANDFEKV